MSLVSVPAIYDGKNVRLQEPVLFREPYRVLVTFVEPAGVPVNWGPFWDSFGAWEDDRPVDETIKDIYTARRSKTQPPQV